MYSTDDTVHIVYDDAETDGIVIFASPNGRSLMLGFDDILGGYVGMMPVLDATGTGTYHDLIAGHVVHLTALARHP